jgi:Pretoxin HINT domain
VVLEDSFLMHQTATNQTKPSAALWRLLALVLTVVGSIAGSAEIASAFTVSSPTSSSGHSVVVGAETRVGVTNHFSGGSSARISSETPACVGKNVTGYDGFVLVSCVATNTLAECSGNSFSHETEVVMADGTRKPISELEVGDRVLATDPETGLTAGREVTAVHLNLDSALADVTVIDSDGDVSTINTTQHHPFWNVGDSKWTDVVDLDNGDRLRSTDGSLLTVVSVRSFKGEQWMWDLTIDDIHTFYVANGDEPILVHNCSLAAINIARHADEAGQVIPGVDDVADYVHAVMKSPGKVATRGRTVWWDDAKGVIVIEEGGNYGTVFAPDRGYAYYLDQLLE